MNKNMSFIEYQKQYLTPFEYQYDTMTSWGFYINIDTNTNTEEKNTINDIDNIDYINDINESMIDEYDPKYNNDTFLNCVLQVAPCILIFYCFV